MRDPERDPERLDKFYARLCEIHKKCFPDWRFGQMIMNLMYYCQQNNIDPFYYEEDKFIKVVEVYFGRLGFGGEL